MGTGFTASTGFYRGSRSFEVLDLTEHLTGRPARTFCAPPPDLPLAVGGVSNAVGAFWDGAPHICGGLNGFEQLEGCYAYRDGAW